MNDAPEIEVVSDIVEAYKGYPAKADRVILRLLRYHDPVVGLFTESNPLPTGHGPVDITFEGQPVRGHHKLILLLATPPVGKTVHVEIELRGDLQRWATTARFTYCEPAEAALVSGSSGFSIPAATGSSARLNRGTVDPRATPRVPPDPDSAIG